MTHPSRRQFLAATAAATAAAGLISACGPAAATAPHLREARKRHGGDLKVGLTGGSSSDTLDPHKGAIYLDFSRLNAVYNPLVLLDAAARVQYSLAEEIIPPQRLAVPALVAFDLPFFRILLAVAVCPAVRAGLGVPGTGRVDDAPADSAGLTVDAGR